MPTSYRLVEFLVRVAQGRPPNDDNKRGYFPYGRKAAESNFAFLEVPWPMMAHTLTVIYPFIRYDRSEWVTQRLIRDPNIPTGTKGAVNPARHPLNAGGLWEIHLMKRYEKFFHLFREKRDKLFESYEDQEGQYHGNPPAPTIQPAGGSGARRRLTMAEVEAMTDEDEPNSMDDEFM